MLVLSLVEHTRPISFHNFRALPQWLTVVVIVIMSTNIFQKN
jgi:hypothetical protein